MLGLERKMGLAQFFWGRWGHDEQTVLTCDSGSSHWRKIPILVEEKHHFDTDHNMTTLQCFDSGESAIFSRFFVKIMQVCQNLVANLNFKDHYFDTKDFD